MTCCSIAVSVGRGRRRLRSRRRARPRGDRLHESDDGPLGTCVTDSPDEPTRPASELMLTIRPHLRSTIPGRTALVSRRTP